MKRKSLGPQLSWIWCHFQLHKKYLLKYISCYLWCFLHSNHLNKNPHFYILSYTVHWYSGKSEHATDQQIDSSSISSLFNMWGESWMFYLVMHMIHYSLMFLRIENITKICFYVQMLNLNLRLCSWQYWVTSPGTWPVSQLSRLILSLSYRHRRHVH